MTAPSSPPGCQATRADGRPCGGRARASGFCLFHDPAYQEQRAAARAVGGRNKAATARVQRLMPASLRPVLDLLYTALEDLAEGELEPRQATAMAAVASAISRIYEVSELAARLQTLESVLEPERAKLLALRRR